MAKVLIVEDEAVISMMLEVWLTDLGHEVAGSASTIQKALGLIEAEKFDAAILDVSLGGSLSYEVADALRRHGIPFAWGTGYSERDIKPEYRDEAIVAKPYLPDVFAEAIAMLLANRSGMARVV